MEIYILRNGKEIGPLSEETTQTMLKEGSISPGDFAWCPGMSDWGPLSEVLKPVPAVVPPAPPAAEGSPAETSAQPLSAEPATEKQKAFFSYLGIAFSPDLTKDAASVMINDATEDPKNTARVQQWNEDRLKLHPELFATEIQAKKENRAHHFFELCQTECVEYFTTITKAHCQVLVGFLDVKFPNWDARQDEAAEKFFYPAIAEKFPQLVQKQWRGKFHYAEGKKATAKIAGQAATGALKKPRLSPLMAVARGIVFGVLILGVLYLVQRIVQQGAGRTSPTSKSVEEPAPVAPKPAEIARPTQTQPVVDAAPPVEPPKASTPTDQTAANLAKPPAPTPDPGAAPSAMAAGEPVASPMATTTAPMASLPGSEPPVPVAPPPATLPAPATIANTSPEPAPTPPATTPEPARTATPRTSVLLTKPVEIPSPYGTIKLGVGTPVKLLTRQGASVKVGYLNNVFTVPVTSTDLEADAPPAP